MEIGMINFWNDIIGHCTDQRNLLYQSALKAKDCDMSLDKVQKFKIFREKANAYKWECPFRIDFQKVQVTSHPESVVTTLN